MSGLVARFDDDVVRLHLARLALLDASGYRSARINIGEYMVGEVQDRLDGQRLVDGSAMPPSAASAARGDADTSGKTLIDSHRLYDSYVYQLTGAGVEVGSAVVYAAIHHHGGDTGRNSATHILARPVLGNNDQDEATIGRYLLQAIERMQ